MKEKRSIRGEAIGGEDLDHGVEANRATGNAVREDQVEGVIGSLYFACFAQVSFFDII